MNKCPDCYLPYDECHVSTKSFYCPYCKLSYGLNFQYHLAFILAPVIVTFVYLLTRNMW